MTTTEIREKILTDQSFVSSEIQKLITYYKLKHILRWNDDSNVIDEKESVAEHVFGMHILADYFLPLQENKLNTLEVKKLILWHDMSEALVDDMSTLSKTAEHKEAEKNAENELIQKAPVQLKDVLEDVFYTYSTLETPETKFVKAIDKLEPLMQIRFLCEQINYQPNNEKKEKSIVVMNKYQSNRLVYISDYPDILEFSKILNYEINTSNFIHPEADVFGKN